MSKILTRYDPPEKREPGQAIEAQGDIWSLGIVIFDMLQTLKIGFSEESSENKSIDFKELSEDGRRVIIKETIHDNSLQ